MWTQSAGFAVVYHLCEEFFCVLKVRVDDT